MDIFYKSLPLLLFIVIPFLAFKVFVPAWNKYRVRKLMKFKPILSIPDETGFTIITEKAELKNSKWTDIKNIHLKRGRQLLVNYNDGSMLTVPKDEYHGWLSLVRAIPQSINMDDKLLDFKRSYFSNLSCCKICGKVAMKEEKCLNCASETYEKYRKDVEGDEEEKILSEREFIRQDQLDWFSGFVDGSKVEFYLKDMAFDNCAGWSPLVTAAEVIKYEKAQE